jgi:hypothetical protein
LWRYRFSHSLLSALDIGEWTISPARPLYPRGTRPPYQLDGKVEAVVKGKISTPLAIETQYSSPVRNVNSRLVLVLILLLLLLLLIIIIIIIIIIIQFSSIEI